VVPGTGAPDQAQYKGGVRGVLSIEQRVLEDWVCWWGLHVVRDLSF
jgi:hypothetical protein